VAGCFGNWEVLPEADIDDAVNSITIVLESKIRSRFYQSPLFITLTRMALDFSKEMPSKIRKALIEIVVSVSEDVNYRKFLLQMEAVHSLIQVAIDSCQTESKVANKQTTNINVEEEGGYSKEAVRILYNLANFDLPKFYIPGETVRWAREKNKFLIWGGLFALYYISSHSKNSEITEFCEKSKLKDLDVKEIENIINSLKELHEEVAPVAEKNTAVVSSAEEQKDVITNKVQETTTSQEKVCFPE
jgi:hypothetical protein